MLDLRNLELFIFDMDGTLVDSALDFDLIRHDLNFPKGAPILEYIETLSPREQDRAFEIVNKHELEGAQRATEMSGVSELLNCLKSLNKKSAVLTRNSKIATEETLKKFDWSFDLILTRDCISKQKPHPEGLLKICNELSIKVSNACYIGDYRFDLEAAKNAGMPGILYDQTGEKHFQELANFTYQDHQELIERLK